MSGASSIQIEVQYKNRDLKETMMRLIHKSDGGELSQKAKIESRSRETL
jgi:hypothetical protein